MYSALTFSFMSVKEVSVLSDCQEPERAETKACKDKLVFELGQRIARIRAEKRMTQAFVANRMKTVRSGNLVSQYERGKLEMGVTVFLDFAQALGVTPNELVPNEQCLDAAPTSLCTANGYDKLTNKNKQIIDYMIKAFLTHQIVESRAVG